MSSGVTRWLYWLDALEKATPQDFPRLARLAQGDSTALRFVAARWVEVDPKHMLETIAAASTDSSGLPVNALAQVLFEEWPKRDPKAVIAALNSVPRFKGDSNWRMHVAGTVFGRDVELGLQLMSDWHVDNYIPGMNGVSKWAAADPRHAAQFTYDRAAGIVSREMMKTIGKEWGKIDPVAALEFANAKSGELGLTLGNSALNEWASRDLHTAADWLAATDGGTRSRLASAFVEAWARDDALAAMEWCALNLSGSSLAQAVGGVMKGAAQTDVNAAQALVAAMSPSGARAEAAASVAQKAFPESFSGKSIAPEAVAWLKQLDPESMKRALDEVSWRWISIDARGFADFLAAHDNEKVPAYIFPNLARNLARQNPAEALEWAAQLPAERGLTVGTAAFNEWRGSQPEAALNWLSSLPESDWRRQPFVEQVVSLLAHEPKTAEPQPALNSAERAAARRIVETLPATDMRRAKLLGMLK
jgi:hypothetical protein